MTNNMPARKNNLYNVTFTDPHNAWGSILPNISTWSVGIEQQLNKWIEMNSTLKNTSYPPYNIVKVDEDHHEVELAVAGFNKSDINISVKDSVLTIEGKKDTDDDAEIVTEYVHKGIAQRNFTQTFVLAEYVRVTNATLVDGILRVSLERELPEEKKAKIIDIE
jgi:molecular chaperone IbpA